MYTGKEIRKEAYLSFAGQAITAVGKKAVGELVGEFQVVTPAFIDPHSHIGLVRAGEPAGEEEANERMESIVALADPLDSLQMDDPSLRDAVEHGVLYFSSTVEG